MRTIPNNSTPIINPIIEKLAIINLSSYEMSVVMAVIRKTYGWDKKEDWIAGSQLSLMTGILQNHCYRTIKKLISKKILKKKKNRIGINKKVHEWVVPERVPMVPKQVVPKQVDKDTQTCTSKIPKQVYTKDTITKETYTKENTPPPKKKKQYSESSDPIVHSFYELCTQRKIACEISPKRYLEMRDEYSPKLNWWEEVRGCVNWLYDKELKKITTGRLRNRMTNAIKFNREKILRAQTKESDDKMQKLAGVTSTKKEPLWEPPI